MFGDRVVNPPARIVVAVSGASGSIYARQLLERLLALPTVERVALIMTANGEAVARHEGRRMPEGEKITRYGVDDMFASPASGSARWDAMVIVPCSMGCLGRIAAGTSDDLVARAADVMLKERRELVLVVRETPLNRIHLNNMSLLASGGATILPATPSFYSKPTDIESLCATVTDRVLSILSLAEPAFRWGIE